jgi:hypothetical protein
MNGYQSSGGNLLIVSESFPEATNRWALCVHMW